MIIINHKRYKLLYKSMKPTGLEILAVLWYNKKKSKEASVMTEQRKQINYTVALVSEFARKHRLSQQEAFEFLFTHRAIEFIKQNYDIEHTLSFEEALDDMMIICRNNGGVI